MFITEALQQEALKLLDKERTLQTEGQRFSSEWARFLGRVENALGLPVGSILVPQIQAQPQPGQLVFDTLRLQVLPFSPQNPQPTSIVTPDPVTVGA